MKVAVIAIGDELLIGQVTDTNSGEIARRITPLGWSLSSTQIVHDNEASIITAIDRAFGEADIVITTGGLGPTKDDITKHTLCRYFGGELVHDPATYENVKQIFASRGLTMNDLTAMQAMVPSTCNVIQNQVGTAPITWWQRDDKKALVSMPGVPFETIHMLDAAVIPMLRSMFPPTESIEHRTTVVAGISESQLAIDIAQFEDSLPTYLHLAYLPKDSIVRLRIDGTHPDAAFLNDEINRYQAQLINMLGKHAIAAEDLAPEEILLKKLKALGLTIATAESCTGGNIAHIITSCPGASDVYKGSVVSYANSVKTSLLGVDINDIELHGAVSREVVEQMALGAKEILATDIAIATSGIAGPGGGTPEKPVGTVWIAVATPSGVVSILHHLSGSRERVITQATTRAITLAIQNI